MKRFLLNKFLVSVLVMVSFLVANAMQVKSAELDDEPVKGRFDRGVRSMYEELSLANQNNMPSLEVFSFAMKGYNKLKAQKEIKKDILTVIDFSLSSNEKRLWIIDIKNGKVLFNDLVAHGRNSGNEFASKFSNVPNTNMSSLGFFVTGKTYQGKHGLSLFLNGKDRGFNHNARKRAIVMHGANYVSHDFIRKYGRLGRSFGCPSVSMEIHEDVITTIADGSAMFIYYPDNNYLDRSLVLN